MPHPRLRESVGAFERIVQPGLTAKQVMRKVGQPFLRQDLTYTYCATSPGDRDVRMKVALTPAGRVAAVRRG